MINFKAGRQVVSARRKREAEFEVLPLIEQIRLVVREEIARAASERDRLERETHRAEEMLFLRPRQP